MRRVATPLAAVAVIVLLLGVFEVPSSATARPVVTGLSTHAGTYWGGKRITVRGVNLTHVKRVMFGAKQGHGVRTGSGRTLTVAVPEHSYGRIHVRVVTSTGTSSGTTADAFTFTRPTMNSSIMGGLTGRQEQRISARVRAAHHNVRTAHASARWTAAMGVTAMERARSWLGLPYSWAGGNGSGPTTGVCAHNGGDLDCHIVGFDCSGLSLYAWAPYEALVHHAATQYSRAGRFHPTVGELMPGDLVFFSGYIADGIGHVAVYEGNGMVIQAAESGTRVMRSRLVDVIAHSGTYRGATRPLTVGRQGPAPHVSSATAQISSAGGYVTVTGTQLASAVSVTVGGITVYSFVQHSATRIVVKVPAHRAGPATLAVSTAWGDARRTLTYVAAPVASALTPSRGPVGGGNTVTVTGKNLASTDEVAVGTTTVPVETATSSSLTFTMPAHAAGKVDVSVHSPFGTSRASVYIFLAPTPGPSPTTGSSSTATAQPSTSTSPPAPQPSNSESSTTTPTSIDSSSTASTSTASTSTASTSTASTSTASTSTAAGPSGSPAGGPTGVD